MIDGLGRWGRAVLSLDLRSLALFRMGLGVAVGLDLARRMLDARAHYSDAGIIPRADLIALRPHRFDWYLSLHLVNGEPWFQVALFAAGVVLAALLVVGFRSRTVCFLLWLGVLSAQFRNPFIAEGFDVYARTLLFWGLFLPLGARFSLDGAARGAPRAERHLSAGTAILVAQIFIVYFASGLFKLESEAWRSGVAIDNTLQLAFYARPWSAQLAGLPGLSAALGYGTLVLELGFPFLLLLPRWTHVGRLAFIAGLGSLHVGIALLMDVGLFSFLSLAALAALLPAEAWSHQAVRRGTEALASRPWPMLRACARPLLRRVQGLPNRIVPGRPSQVAALLAFGLVVHYNVASFANPKRIPDYPRVVLQPLLTLRLNQEWSMFANPRAPTTRFDFVRATLDDGRELNPLDGEPFRPVFEAGAYSRQFPGHRWKKLFIRVFRRADLQKLYARYVCRTDARTVEVTFLVGASEHALLEGRSFACRESAEWP